MIIYQGGAGLGSEIITWWDQLSVRVIHGWMNFGAGDFVCLVQL